MNKLFHTLYIEYIKWYKIVVVRIKRRQLSNENMGQSVYKWKSFERSSHLGMLRWFVGSSNKITDEVSKIQKERLITTNSTLENLFKYEHTHTHPTTPELSLTYNHAIVLPIIIFRDSKSKIWDFSRGGY